MKNRLAVGTKRFCCIAAALISNALAATEPSATKIPLCSGLTVVTAISQKEGDYESIKTVTSVDASKVQLKYSSEQPPEQYAGGLRIRKLNLTRIVRANDFVNSKQYEQIFATNIPAEIPGTTAIGTSRAVLLALKTKGEADLSMFDIPVLPGASSRIAADPKQHPNVFDYAENYKLRRAENTPVMLPLIVNDAKTQVAAIHATGRGDSYGYRAEFFFLDDENNPLALKWRLGIGAGTGPKAGQDRDLLQLIKISYTCASTAGQSWLERMLAETGHADIYSIYFSFNSDELREESEPTLKEISDIMRRHPDWKLSIAGHTDAIGGDAPNLDLSKRRAASVKTALLTRYSVNAGRLTTNGFGKSRPVDTNETEEGRARNRRVELVRFP